MSDRNLDVIKRAKQREMKMLNGLLKNEELKNKKLEEQ